MAQISLWSCDNCGNEFRSGEGQRVKLVTENSATSTYSDEADLCANCMLQLIHDMATQVNVVMRAEILSRYTSRRES